MKRWCTTWTDTLAAYGWNRRYAYGANKTQIVQGWRKIIVQRFGFDEKSTFVDSLMKQAWKKFADMDTYAKFHKVYTSEHMGKLTGMKSTIAQYDVQIIWDNCHEYYTRHLDEDWKNGRKKDGPTDKEALVAVARLDSEGGRVDYLRMVGDSPEELYAYLQTCNFSAHTSLNPFGYSGVEQVLKALYAKDLAMFAYVRQRVFGNRDLTDADHISTQVADILLRMQVEAVKAYFDNTDVIRERAENRAKMNKQSDWLVTMQTLDPHIDWAMTYEDGEEQIQAFKDFYIPQVAMMALSYDVIAWDRAKIREMIIATVMGAENEEAILSLNEGVIDSLVDLVSAEMGQPDKVHEHMETILKYNEQASTDADDGEESSSAVQDIVYERYEIFCHDYYFKKHKTPPSAHKSVS